MSRNLITHRACLASCLIALLTASCVTVDAEKTMSFPEDADHFLQVPTSISADDVTVRLPLAYRSALSAVYELERHRVEIRSDWVRLETPDPHDPVVVHIGELRIEARGRLVVELENDGPSRDGLLLVTTARGDVSFDSEGRESLKCYALRIENDSISEMMNASG